MQSFLIADRAKALSASPMKFLSKFQSLFIFCLLSAAVPSFIQASELRKLENLRLVPHPSNDGDSFRATDGEETFYIRLYFVDCKETSADSETMARRVREQTRYFGLDRHEDTVHYGNEATRWVEGWLKEPFTAYTTFADAMGRSTMRRIFAFVVTADGEDLDALLVGHGLARTYGVGREDYRGVHRDERRAYLEDLELEAMLDRRGVWAATNTSRLAALRAAQRAEQAELHAIRSQLSGALAEGEKLNLNTATSEELQRIPGIGPALAARIISARPYPSIENLLRVSGIGPGTLARIEDHLIVESQ